MELTDNQEISSSSGRRTIAAERSDLYQEPEMDSPFVDTYRDSTAGSVSIQLHSHRFYELIYCRSASNVDYQVEDDLFRLQKGDIVFLPPRTLHRPILPARMEKPYVRDIIWINEDFLMGLHSLFLPEAPFPATPVGLIRLDSITGSNISDLFRRGVLESEAGDPGWQTAVVSSTLAILTQLRRALFSRKPEKPEKAELLEQILSYVELHLADKLNLSDVAKHFFISESTITQTFRKKMGMSFYRCVTQKRLAAAKALIEQGLPLETVAEKVGFNDYSAFFRAFKQECGISPRAYKKQGSIEK